MSREESMETQLKKMVNDAKEIAKQANKFSQITVRQKSIIEEYEILIESWINLDPTLEEHNPSILESIKEKTKQLKEFIKAEAQEIE